jgi:hypothetical protein
MSSQDLHQVILRWPHTDANEVIVTGTFDQWSHSLRLTRKPDGFEAPPVFVPWREKIAYKFIVDGRWMTNDAEPTEVDHGFVNNVYTAPPKPVPSEPEPSTAPPSYHSESEVEHEPAEKVAADKLTTVVRESTPTPTADNGSGATTVDITVETVRETVAPAVEAAQAAVAQVAPAPIEVEKAADEITSEPKVAPAPAEIPVPELAPKVPIGILPNSMTPSENARPAAAAQVDSEHERSTHVPLRFATGTLAPAVVPQVKEVVVLAPESVPLPEESTPAPVEEEDVPEATLPTPIEEEDVPEVTLPTPIAEEEEPEETTPAPVAEEGEPEASAAPEEPAPAPEAVPAVVEEPVSAPPEEVAAPASQEPAAPSSEPAPEPAPAIQVPAAEPTPEATPAAEPTPVVEAAAPASEPTPVFEAAATKAPVAAPEPTTPQVAVVELPPVNGHSKTMSGASTSSATASLPATPARKASRKFSFPGHGRDKSGSSSPTGSSRFASREKRDKRHSLLGKLKEIFSDKGKKEKSEAKA